MKRLCIITCLLGFLLHWNELYGQASWSICSEEINDALKIGADDSVNFSLPLAFSNGIYTDIPLYFESDDTVYSVDFALKYNMQLMEFDSIIDHTGSFLFLYYFNWNDSTLRFTSNNLVPLNSSQPLISIRMRNYLQSICFNDFLLVNAWLNGDTCTGTVSGCIPGVSGTDEWQNENQLYINVNSSSGELDIKSPESGVFRIIDMTGKVLFQTSIRSGSTTMSCYPVIGRKQILIGELITPLDRYYKKFLTGY